MMDSTELKDAIVLSRATVSGDRFNISYPDIVACHNAEELAESLKMDTAFCLFKDGKRSNERIIEGYGVMMDVDNDETEEPSGWITPEDIKDLFEEVRFAIAPSRHNMKDKKDPSGKVHGPRPRFHVFFPFDAPCSDSLVMKGIKVALHKDYTFFDDNALDAARFCYGCDIDPKEVVWNA